MSARRDHVLVITCSLNLQFVYLNTPYSTYTTALARFYHRSSHIVNYVRILYKTGDPLCVLYGARKLGKLVVLVDVEVY